MSDKYEELEKLQSLKEREIISEEEFQSEKEKILNAPEKKNIEFNFKKIVDRLKKKRRIFIIIAVVLMLISIVCNAVHDSNYEQAGKVDRRWMSVYSKKSVMEIRGYYDEEEYEELCEKEEELSEKASEYMNKADNAAIVFYTFIYLALFMCLLHAIFTLKGNNLSKKDFLIKLVKRMVVPVIIIILWILICDI